MVSAKPPVFLTIGTVPYLRLNICPNPHGSKKDGIINKSLEAYILCANVSSNKMFALIFPGYCCAILLKIYSYLFSPVPKSTNCISSLIISPNTCVKMSNPFWSANLVIIPIIGTSLCSNPRYCCNSLLFSFFNSMLFLSKFLTKRLSVAGSFA